MKKLLSLLFVGVACAGQRPPPGPPPTPEALFRELQAADRLATEADIEWFGEDRARFRGILVVERPNRFRIEVLSPFEEPLEVVVSDGQTLWRLTPDRFRTGPATPERVAEVLPVPLSPEDLVALILGGAPGEGWRIEAVEPSRDPRAWRARMRNGPHIVDVWVAEDGRRILRIRFLDADVDARFSDFEAAHPRGMKVRSERGRLRIRLRDPSFGGAPTPELFRLSPPPGVVPESLDG
ncbi:MAG: outer-membrane lipoprotein carrier protein LolA [Myxococcota bacterium]